MQIIYLSHVLRHDGPLLLGRSLMRHLASEHDVRLCGAIVEDDSELLKTRDDVAAFSELEGIDAVVMEGGWNAAPPSLERFPSEAASNFVRTGGQLIVADVDRNSLNIDRQPLLSARELFGATPFSESGKVSYLLDETIQEAGGVYRFSPDKMRFADWLRPAWEGIDSVLATLMVPIAGGDVLASGHETTDILAGDLFESIGSYAPWASAAQYGAGHSILIGGGVTGDVLVDANPDNARWITNLLQLLESRTHEFLAWKGPKNRSPKSREGSKSLLHVEESQNHERKSSFLVSVDPRRPDLDKKVLQEMVGKSIAALANTDGGNLVIGQDDDGTILGLQADFNSLSKAKGRDGFELDLVQYVSNKMSPGWESVGLKISWLEVDGKAVAIVGVPQSDKPVHLDLKNGDKGAVFVRRGTRTDRLEGLSLTEWLQSSRFLR